MYMFMCARVNECRHLDGMVACVEAKEQSHEAVLNFRPLWNMVPLFFTVAYMRLSDPQASRDSCVCLHLIIGGPQRCAWCHLGSEDSDSVLRLVR